LDINFQRAVDRVIGVPICALLSLFDRLFGAAAPAQNPRRILVILLSEMGSLVLAYPMFARIRERYPDAELHVLMFGKNREVLDLMGVVKRENVLTISDKSLSELVRDSLDAITGMRALKFDVVIDCELFARISSIFSYLSGAATRVGFYPHTQEGLYRGTFINRRVLYNPYRHLSRQFLTMVEAIESTGTPPAKGGMADVIAAPPQLLFEAGEAEKIRAQLHADFPALRDRKLILVYPGGGILPIRAWPLQNYQALCAELLKDGHAVAVIGLKEDGRVGDEIVAHCGSEYCVNLAGYTKSIRHLLALFNCASLLVTNDGGPGQFAALTALPALVFFGPETPALYSPIAPNIHCLYSSMSCSPCLTAYNHRASPCDGDNQCLKQIAPESVLRQARELLGAGN
jgi:ADP-heptose:LPS heptosyltransferase